MKTAISVPNDVFRRVEERAKALGLNRSEFYSRAAESYLEHLDREGLRERIDAALADSGDEAVRDQLDWAHRASAALATGDINDEPW